MEVQYRQGSFKDIDQVQALALKAWSPYKMELTSENWANLYASLSSTATFTQLFNQSYCLLCETNAGEIIGMTYLVPKGNPTDIYQKNWAYIRFVSVAPAYAGKGIGRALMERCIEMAKHNQEQFVALHTSEMMHHARKLYANLGFKMLREIDERLGKRYWLYLLEI